MLVTIELRFFFFLVVSYIGEAMLVDASFFDEKANRKPSHKIYFLRKNSELGFRFMLRSKSSMQRSST